MVNLGQSANGCEILRRGPEHKLKLLLRLVEPTDFEERATECHVRRQVRGMPLQAIVTCIDGLLILP